MDRILKKLKEMQEEIKLLYSQLDFNRDKDGSREKMTKIISIFNAVYPLAGFVNWRFQEELNLNLREFEHRYYIQVTATPYLKTCMSILEKLINIIETQMEFSDLIPTQKYYSQNRKFSVLKDLDTIFKTAKQSILYYDPYMDYIIAEALEDMPISDIKLMLFNPTDKFKLWIEEYNKEKGKNIEYVVPKLKSIHDRYCLIDGTELWQISGSVNAKNLNSITISKIDEEKTRNQIIKDISSQENI